jgi:hypothetical protein
MPTQEATGPHAIVPASTRKPISTDHTELLRIAHLRRRPGTSRQDFPTKHKHKASSNSGGRMLGVPFRVGLSVCGIRPHNTPLWHMPHMHAMHCLG